MRALCDRVVNTDTTAIEVLRNVRLRLQAVLQGITHYAIELLDAPGRIFNGSHGDETKAARAVGLNWSHVNFWLGNLELQNPPSGRKRW